MLVFLTILVAVLCWIVVAFCVLTLSDFAKNRIGENFSRKKKGAIKEGDEIFVRMYYSDERGNMVKHRNFTVISIDVRENGLPTFVQIAGNEPADQDFRKKEFNL